MNARHRVVMYMTETAMVTMQSVRKPAAGWVVWVFSLCLLGALRMLADVMFIPSGFGV